VRVFQLRNDGRSSALLQATGLNTSFDDPTLVGTAFLPTNAGMSDAPHSSCTIQPVPTWLASKACGGGTCTSRQLWEAEPLDLAARPSPNTTVLHCAQRSWPSSRP
jgi:hypothetical protein